MALPPTFDARLVRARPLSPSVRELCFERVDGAPFAFEAGQWVSLILPTPDAHRDAGEEIRRAYSIASPPDRSPGFELAVTRVPTGPGSTYLHGLEPGAVLKAVGPQGFFTRAPGSGGLFVGTGTGVAPLRSMLRDAVGLGLGLEQAQPAPMCLLFGVRNREEILYKDELERLANEHPHVRIEVTLSRPDDGWKGRRGYVQLHVRELYERLASGSSAPPHVFVCGLERMVSSVREILKKEMGLPRTLVHSERYD